MSSRFGRGEPWVCSPAVKDVRSEPASQGECGRVGAFRNAPRRRVRKARSGRTEGERGEPRGLTAQASQRCPAVPRGRSNAGLQARVQAASVRAGCCRVPFRAAAARWLGVARRAAASLAEAAVHMGSRCASAARCLLQTRTAAHDACAERKHRLAYLGGPHDPTSSQSGLEKGP